MAEESDFGGGIQKTVEGLRGSENVFILVLKRSVDKHNAIGGKRSLRQT